MDKIFLETHDVVKRYANHTALNGVSIKVPEGKVFGLLGPNGAGKTTLIRIINRITVPDSGSVTFNGHPLSVDDICNIGYLPEERGLYKKMRVGEQAIYLARLKGLDKAEAEKRLRQWFDKFGIMPVWAFLSSALFMTWLAPSRVQAFLSLPTAVCAIQAMLSRLLQPADIAS